MSEPTSDNPTLRQVPEDAPENAPPAPEQIARHFPQLDIIEVLGFGGMGVVYKARQKGLDRIVAVKILPPDPARDPRFAERFAREARAMASLQHPNIVTIHDSGQAGDLYYLIMEYVDGANLRGVIRAGGLSPRDALSIVQQMCDAIQYAHDEGIMHRDIKPENILVDLQGRVKIADFGLVKLLNRTATRYTLTAPLQVMGTMHYMAPEQIESTADVDHRADIYALGVVIYELLTGELPIGRFPLPSERSPVDPRIDEVVLHALAKDPERRYQRVADVKTDFLAASSSPSATAGPAPTLVPPGVGPGVGPGRPTPAPSYPAPGTALAGVAPVSPKSAGTAYLLWVLCFFGLFGLHRFYVGRWVTGIVWLLTGGVFFIGQLIDLFFVPGMVKISNLESALIEREMAAARRSGWG